MPKVIQTQNRIDRGMSSFLVEFDNQRTRPVELFNLKLKIIKMASQNSGVCKNITFSHFVLNLRDSSTKLLEIYTVYKFSFNLKCTIDDGLGIC